MVGTKVLIDHIDKHECGQPGSRLDADMEQNGPDVVTRVPQWPEYQPDVVAHLQMP